MLTADPKRATYTALSTTLLFYSASACLLFLEYMTGKHFSKTMYLFIWLMSVLFTYFRLYNKHHQLRTLRQLFGEAVLCGVFLLPYLLYRMAGVELMPGLTEQNALFRLVIAFAAINIFAALHLFVSGVTTFVLRRASNAKVAPKNRALKKVKM